MSKDTAGVDREDMEQSHRADYRQKESPYNKRQLQQKDIEDMKEENKKDKEE